MIDIDPEIEVGFREALQEAFARGRAQSEPDRDLRRAVKSLAKQVRILKSADQPRDHAGRFAETSHAIASEHDRHMVKVQKMGDAEAAGEHATKATSGAFKRIKESAGKHWAHARDRIRGILPPGDAERLIELVGDGAIAEAMDDVGEALDARKAVAESEGTRPEREEAREEVTHRIDRLHRAIEAAVEATKNERAVWREGKSLAGRDEPDFTERLAFLRKAWEEVRLLKSVDASGHEHKGKGPGGGQFGKGGGGDSAESTRPDHKFPDRHKKGASVAEVQYASSIRAHKQEADELATKLFGSDDAEPIAAVVGAPDDAVVKFKTSFDDPNKLQIEIHHDDLEQPAIRFVYKDAKGKLVIENSDFRVKPDRQGKGLGTEIFARQVEQAEAMGVDRIECHAAKLNANPRFNGYYTWPRFGYDEHLETVGLDSPAELSKVEECRRKFPEAKTVLDVMSTKEGAAWWKENGLDMTKAQFDLKPGSRAMAILTAYLDAKAESRVSKSLTYPRQTKRLSTRSGSESTRASDRLTFLRKSFDEAKHPRDDGGRFVSVGRITDAKGNKEKADALRAEVTDPKERAKLDAVLGEEPESDDFDFTMDAPASAYLDPRLDIKPTSIRQTQDEKEAAKERGDKLHHEASSAFRERADEGRYVPKEDAPLTSTAQEDDARLEKIRRREAYEKKLATKPEGHSQERTAALLAGLPSKSGGKKTEHLEKIQHALRHHSHAELKAIKEKLGIRASGTKKEVAAKLAERAARRDRSNRTLYSHEPITVDEAVKLIQGHDATAPGAAGKVANLLASRLSSKQLSEVKKKLGIKASGTKWETARKLVNREAAKPVPQVDPKADIEASLASNDTSWPGEPGKLAPKIAQHARAELARIGTEEHRAANPRPPMHHVGGTWTKAADGSWHVKVPHGDARPGDTATVRTRAGKEKTVRLGEVTSHGDGTNSIGQVAP